MKVVYVISLLCLLGIHIVSFGMYNFIPDNFLDIKEAVRLQDYALLERVVFDCKRSLVLFSDDGDTPLTLVLEECTKRHFCFFKRIFSLLRHYINTPNRSGKLPLQIALEKGLLFFAVELVKEGADIMLIERDLLKKRIEGTCLINQIIFQYVAHYRYFLGGLKENRFIEDRVVFSLEQLISNYCIKCNIGNGQIEGGGQITDFFDEQRVLTVKILRNRKSIRRRLFSHVSCYFKMVFLMQSLEDFDSMCFTNVIDTQWKRLNREVKQNMCANLHSDMQVNFVEASRKRYFSDLEVACLQ